MSNSKENKARLAGAIDVVVIGAGHAGLAASFLLTEHGIEHIVLERGEVGNTWRNERWDSLKLLTPNWQTRLPGYYYAGDDPDGYMSMPELIRFMEDYADRSRAPIQTNTNVTSVRKTADAYQVTTNRGTYVARAVIIASGACNTPSVPGFAGDIPAHIAQLTGHDYRSPECIAPGNVLVVGASATGLQLADELLQAGHDVTMAVSEHVRMPRQYRGRNILDWMADSGILDERYDEVEDIARGRRLPSSQLVGASDRAIFDLNSLSDRGLQIAGRLMGVNNGVAQFSGSLRNIVALADLKMKRLLNTIDEFIADDVNTAAGDDFDDTRIDENPLLTMDLDEAGIRTVIWATGFKPDYSWLGVPVFDRKGQLKHDGGIVESAGLYVLGLPLMRRRKSSFIFGIEDDARDITDHLVKYLDLTKRSTNHGVHQHHTHQSGLRPGA